MTQKQSARTSDRSIHTLTRLSSHRVRDHLNRPDRLSNNPLVGKQIINRKQPHTSLIWTVNGAKRFDRLAGMFPPVRVEAEKVETFKQ